MTLLYRVHNSTLRFRLKFDLDCKFELPYEIIIGVLICIHTDTLPDFVDSCLVLYVTFSYKILICY